MRIEYDGAQLRRYVLGTSTADEREAIERDYFARENVVDQVSAAEEDLIDDYLSAQLSETDREAFERSYLISPHHRTRVEVQRAIRAASAARAARPMPSATRTARWWAVAASLVVLAATSVWLLRPESGPDRVAERKAAAPDTAAPASTPGPSGGTSRGTTAPAPPSQPVVVAVVISPVLVRSAGENATVTIARGTDIVRLQLRGQAGERLARGRSVIRTVAGREVWRGPVTPIADSSGRALARVDVPASALGPEDYVIELFETGEAGRDVERHKYFLRVLAP